MRPGAVRGAFRSAAVAGALGAAAGATLLTKAIGRSTSSTAAFGFLDLPRVMALWAAPGAVMGFCLGYLIAARGIAGRRASKLLAGLVLLAVAVPAAAYVLGNLETAREVRRVANMDADELERELASKHFGTNPFVLAQVALNPRASPAILRQIALRPDPRLQEKLWNIFDTLGSNRRGLAVLRLVARHPNVDAETLDLLAQCDDGYVLSDVATNPKSSEQTLRRLEERTEPLLQQAIAGSPRTPPDVLARLPLSSNEWVRASVAKNPSASEEALERLAQDVLFHVRRAVALNPASAPPDALRTLAQDSDARVRDARLPGRCAGVPVLHQAPAADGGPLRTWFECSPTP